MTGSPGALSRRSVLALAGATTAALAVRSTGIASDLGPIRFALTPVLLTSDLDLLDRLKSYLENATGRPVQLVTRRTYQEITTLLISSQVDGAWICSPPFVAYQAQLELAGGAGLERQPALSILPDRRCQANERHFDRRSRRRHSRLLRSGLEFGLSGDGGRTGAEGSHARSASSARCSSPTDTQTSSGRWLPVWRKAAASTATSTRCYGGRTGADRTPRGSCGLRLVRLSRRSPCPSARRSERTP